MSWLERMFGRRSDGPQHIDPQGIIASFHQFVAAPTWLSSKRVLEHNLDLLRSDVDSILKPMLRDDREKLKALSQVHIDILRRCRDVGIDLAFAQETCEVGTMFLHTRADRLQPKYEFLMTVITSFDGDQFQNLTSIAFSAKSLDDLESQLNADPELRAEIDRTSVIVLAYYYEFLGADDWQTRQQVVEQRPELLSDTADAVLARWSSHIRDRSMNDNRFFLHTCREVGVNLAFATKTEDVELIRQVVPEFFLVRTNDEIHHIVHQYPVLLTELADAVIVDMANVTLASGQPHLESYLRKTRALLQRCRCVGVDQALKERSGVAWQQESP